MMGGGDAAAASRELSFLAFDFGSKRTGVATGNAMLCRARPLRTIVAALNKIDLLRREERITPAGRFVASRGRNLRGEDIVWVAYDESVSMHRV